MQATCRQLLCCSPRRLFPCRSWRSAARRLAIALSVTGPLILLAPVVRLAAQKPGTLTGTVTAADATPLAHAQVRLVGTALAAVAGADGSFRVGGIPAGAQSLEVKLLGYAPLLLAVDIVSGETLNMRLVLATEGVPLPAVEVKASRAFVTPEMKGFAERRARGAGQFFTREEIVRMQARLLTDVLRRVPGMQIQSVNSAYGTSYAVQTGRSGGPVGTRVCPTLFYMNGSPFPLTTDVTIDHYVAPEEVIGIEVYNGAAQIPPQFNSGMYNAHCGVVVIWTRNGIEPSRR